MKNENIKENSFSTRRRNFSVRENRSLAFLSLSRLYLKKSFKPVANRCCYFGQGLICVIARKWVLESDQSGCLPQTAFWCCVAAQISITICEASLHPVTISWPIFHTSPTLHSHFNPDSSLIHLISVAQTNLETELETNKCLDDLWRLAQPWLCL